MVRPITTFTFVYLFVIAFGEEPENKTIANYDPSELLLKIFNLNDTVPRVSSLQGNSLFLSDNNEDKNYSYKNAVRFSDDIYDNYPETDHGQIGTQDFFKYQDNKDFLNKKKRRKRKPKQQHYGLLNQAVRPNLGFNGIPNAGYGGQYDRPPRPRPSIASGALSAVTDALSSIALNDEYQCVARLLCEAAGGGALGSSGILQTISGLQPLLTLLSAYNGISTNPLFVFGRAVFLGMSSNGNTASCRYAYPLCPTDPERLVHYLNNHNGGFFRFFNSPQQGQQNIEQFYSQLSQSYGLNQQQSYGFYNPNSQSHGLQTHNPYSNYGQHNYGFAFPYNDNNIRFKNSDYNKNVDEIQRRIQNKPIITAYDDSFNTRWTFPGTIENTRINYINSDIFTDSNYANTKREVNSLKFPENNNEETKANIEYDRNTRGFIFPEFHSNRQYKYYNNLKTNDDYNNRIYNQYYINKNTHNVNNDDDVRGVRTVYVIRGNGDPNNPEIIKLKPGETLQ
ncbi:unnamed protein product [Euphydryas editha]|uniref:Uncharacterized protein n=1 Tax=Euphydryas editha TaxID=104508 RepID=A0AAU9UC10_EUPED|nr:unnamed protein product [Euphydryas editha]